jgi:UDP-glucose 4-epimerase
MENPRESNMSRRALITGGAGFIGAHLAFRLAKLGWEVVVADNLAAGSEANFRYLGVSPALALVDVSCAKAVDTLAERPFDWVFHLAAQASVAKSSDDPLQDFDVNVRGSVNILELARRIKCQKMVFASSVAVYSPNAQVPITEEAPTHASSPYGAAKAAGENYCFAYAASYGLPVVVLRLFNIYGPLMRKYFIHDIVRKLQKDPQKLVLLGDGSQVRDYTYVDDAVRAFVLVAERGVNGDVYNVGSGDPVNIGDLAREIAALMGHGGVELSWTGKSWAGDTPRWWADGAKLQKLGFQPQVTRRSGLAQTVGFLVKYPQGLGPQ